jgi:hypothetical protein
VKTVEQYSLLFSRLTMMESSSGNQLGHMGHAAAYAERYKRIIEYIWKVCEARIVKVGLLTVPLNTPSQSRLNSCKCSPDPPKSFLTIDRRYEIDIQSK